MSIEDRGISKKKISKWLAISIFTIFILNLLNGEIQKRKYPYRHPELFSSQYINIEGCEVKSYKFGERISESCADQRYIFEDYRKYGLPSPGRSKVMNGRKCGAYYRIGNDLVAITCIEQNSFYARDTEKSVFVVK